MRVPKTNPPQTPPPHTHIHTRTHTQVPGLAQGRQLPEFHLPPPHTRTHTHPHTHAHTHRSLAWLKAGNYQNCLVDAAMAVALDPTNPKALHKRAQAKWRLGALTVGGLN